MPRKNRNEYNEYMQKYMREHRAYERKLIRMAKKQFGKNVLATPRKRRKKQ